MTIRRGLLFAAALLNFAPLAAAQAEQSAIPEAARGARSPPGVLAGIRSGGPASRRVAPPSGRIYAQWPFRRGRDGPLGSPVTVAGAAEGQGPAAASPSRRHHRRDQDRPGGAAVIAGTPSAAKRSHPRITSGGMLRRKCSISFSGETRRFDVPRPRNGFIRARGGVGGFDRVVNRTVQAEIGEIPGRNRRALRDQHRAQDRKK